MLCIYDAIATITSVLMVQNFAKTSSKGAELDAVADEMGKRFARKSRKVQPVGEASPQELGATV